MGDVLRTNRAGEAQIRFVDNTRIVVGKDARVTIDKFVFDPGGAAEAVTLSAVRGAFRFITGNSRKSVYLIRTPVMTIGVRGTGLDEFVETGTGRTTIALYEGAAQLCDASDQCIDVNRSCQIVVAPPGGGFQDAPATARALFLPYSIAQGGLLPDYRLDVSACSGPTRLFRDSPESSGGRDTGERGGSGGGGSRGGQNRN